MSSGPDRDLGYPRVFDFDQVLLEIHHQPLLDKGVDADEPVAAQIQLPQRRDLEVSDGGRPERQLSDFHPVDEVAGGHAVDDRRLAEWQFRSCAMRSPTAEVSAPLSTTKW